jgi:ubiquinone/menaquinone biosynthesis C-methylase UbiE
MRKVRLWETIFAAGYDHFLAPTEQAGLAAHREHLLRAATGRVLEIGGGTGANLPYYREGVTELVISEPSRAMVRHLERKLPGYPIPTSVVRAPAERLPLQAQSFDCVVSTLVLCTVDSPPSALAEVRRVLKPQGRLLFIEHVRSDDPHLAGWQDRLRRPWSWFGCGCQCNRPTADNIRVAGFSLTQLQQYQLAKAPPLVRPLILGAAQM